MKLKLAIPRRRPEGSALLLVLSLTAVCLILIAATTARTRTDANLNARNNQYQASLYAAEAATEEVVARVKQDFLSGDLTWVTNSLHAGVYQKSVPGALGTTTENPYWTNFTFSDGMGHNGSNYVDCLFTSGWSTLRSQYAGMSGWTNHLFIIANATMKNSQFPITAAVEQDIELDLIPIFQFAIFYNGLLEFTWCAPMTVNGRTHANGNIYTGSQWQLTFNSLVDTTGTVSSPAWDGKTTAQYTDAAIYSTNYSTNSVSLNLPIGSGITNTPASVLEIVKMPPVGGDTNSALAAQRYFNKAGIVLIVTNTGSGPTATATVTAIIRNSMFDPLQYTTNITFSTTNNSWTNYASLTNNFPFLSMTNFWPTNPTPVYDQRESATLKLTDIDVSLLNHWLYTNTVVSNKFPNSLGVYVSQTNAPNIMYVADNRSYTSGQLTAVRLRNATTIPTNLFNFTGSNAPSGFTLATPNPLYIYGNYNLPKASYEGQTNTALNGEYPASLVSDALTILSGKWKDSTSASSATQATNTTVNAAILTGIVLSTGSSGTQFSGGVHNLPRLLEDWATPSAQLTLNTSIVNLFNSVRATNMFQNPTVYYQAPTRNFSFDPNFLYYYKQPPGTPMLSYVIRSKWSAIAPNTTNYAGF